MPAAFDKLYWSRLGFAVVFGILAELLFTNNPASVDGFDGALMGLLGYFISYYFGRYVLYRNIEKEKMSKLYTTGIGGYTMLFVFTWVLLFTLSYVGV